MTDSTKIPNKLINEKSPYLLQHAYNPVDWYPWCGEAFEKARDEGKPIFLSIGYSTCHWCHVMERESFEDQGVADILNEHFICIKVDKEERPDIDHIYMNVCQLFTGSGGWPTSIFMTADQKPFFAGTYFPRECKYGMKGFTEILQNLIEIWQNDRGMIEEAGNSALDLLHQGDERNVPKGETSIERVKEAYLLYSANFDTRYGGSKGAPKFPTPHTLYFLLRYAFLNQDQKALDMAEKTLLSMYEGGIYDHIGFGFCRYSTDGKWLVPHFEKMLYDNALLLIAYAEAYQYTKKEIYKMICEQMVQFIKEEMRSPENGFYTAIDADSEGVEGKFYLWTKREIIEILGKDDGETFCKAYGITEEGNFEGENIPNLIGRGPQNLPESIRRLKEVREKRIKPHKDDKMITSQNGMMIAALAICGRVFQNQEYIEMAENGIKFIEQNLFTPEGRLLTRYRDGEAGILAFADDYAYMIWALIECYETTMNKHYLMLAEKFNAALIRLFWDEERGGVFLYGSDGEQLIKRPKDFYDGAVPSSNSVCAHNFIRLSRLTGFQDLEEMAKKIIQYTGRDSPRASLHSQSAIMHLEKSLDVKIAGAEDTQGFTEMIDKINSKFLPFLSVKFDKEEKEYKTVNGKATAYVCRDFTCAPPTNDLAQMLQ